VGERTLFLALSLNPRETDELRRCPCAELPVPGNPVYGSENTPLKHGKAAREINPDALIRPTEQNISGRSFHAARISEMGIIF
jgi:hypothetical protein